MALCHCQITDRGFADATDMVGPSIEVLRPTSTQTALDAPSGFFTVHMASLKKGLRFPRHSLLIEFLNGVDLLPCQLVPNSHWYIAGYLVRCKAVGVKPTLDHFLFTFKLTKGHGDWASCPSLSQQSSKLFTSDKKGLTKDWKPFFVFVSTGLESPFTGSGLPSFRRVLCPPSNAALLSITRQLYGQGAIEIKKVVTEESLAALGFEFVQDEYRHHPDLLWDTPGEALTVVLLATLGMIELVGRRQDRQAAMDEARKAAEDKQRELQEEVARLARELEKEKGRSAALEMKNASLSSEVGSVSARVAELEGEKTDLIQQLEVERSDQARRLEEAIESFKSSLDFSAVPMERMDKMVVEWLKTGPGVKWMVKESKKSFNCGLFRAQQVFRDKLARIPKGFSFPNLGFPPPCRALAEFGPNPYLDEGSSSASDKEEVEAALDDQGGQGDQGPRANLATSKAGGGASLGI
ncbi:unnamed protein product [Cuscuta campestris]|uniref:Transposase (putative) gypsy type domain-containing protein n=1 Tax=Cuscuta campestris TaxID=132261 RepID=A0A484MZC4_9ASTE|nr:unnamed protein product [Cuscuta campestris]